MPSSCVVSSCSNRYSQSNEISYHKFPNDVTICRQWIEFSNRDPNWKPSRWSSICSRHFEKSCFRNNMVKHSLKLDAVPTILDDNSQSKGLIINNVSQINAASLRIDADEEEIVSLEIKESDEFQTPPNEELIPEYEGLNDEEHEEEVTELQSLEQRVNSLCRLCAGSFDQNQLVCYSSFLNLIIKCFPTLNLELYEYFPRQICFECREKLINFSIFINKTMNAQKILTEALVLNFPSDPCHSENKCIVPSIKQEPIVVIKEEKMDRKTLGLKDKINFKDSKNCEIIKIPSRPQAGSNAKIDDDIEILNSPLKVEEIIEDDDHREHNYVKTLPKIEILEERVFKTEPYFSDFPKLETCEVCKKKSFESRSALEQHMYECHLTAVRFCEPCDFGFLSAIDYLSHKLKIHKVYKQPKKRCPCGRFLRIGLLRKHMRHCPLRKLKCRICNEMFNRTSNYLKHNCKRTEETTSIEVLNVEESNEILANLNELQYNIIYVENQPIQKSFQCEKCLKIISSTTDFDWHKFGGCKRNFPQKFQCQICGTYLSNVYNLKIHENIHTKEISYNCHCGKPFRSKQNLAQHQLTHSLERSYNCELCTKTFKRAGGLKQHVNSFHLNIKPHICPTCQHAYALKADMMRCRHSALSKII